MVEETYPRLYRSAPVPKNAVENHVYNVVGSIFEEVVMDSKKDVLLMVYITQ